MYEVLSQEMMGTSLFYEEEKNLTSKECAKLYKKLDHLALEEGNERGFNGEVYEILYTSSAVEEDGREQFAITVRENDGESSFMLVRRNHKGIFSGEKSAVLTRKQYKDLLMGSIEWMKENSELLFNEFYYKTQIFRYKITAIMKCISEEIQLGYQNMKITIDRCLEVLLPETVNRIRLTDSNMSLVRVRCLPNEQKDREAQVLLEELFE